VVSRRRKEALGDPVSQLTVEARGTSPPEALKSPSHPPREIAPTVLRVDELVAFQSWKSLDGSSGFLLGEAQVIETL
jgi:hypothetical protein